MHKTYCDFLENVFTIFQNKWPANFPIHVFHAKYELQSHFFNSFFDDTEKYSVISRIRHSEIRQLQTESDRLADSEITEAELNRTVDNAGSSSKERRRKVDRRKSVTRKKCKNLTGKLISKKLIQRNLFKEQPDEKKLSK